MLNTDIAYINTCWLKNYKDKRKCKKEYVYIYILLVSNIYL